MLNKDKHIAAMKMTVGQLVYCCMMIGKILWQCFLYGLGCLVTMAIIIFLLLNPWFGVAVVIIAALSKLYMINLEAVDIWDDEDEETGETTIQERTQESGKDQSVH